ncbi:hypothetical protein ACFV2Z_23205 [Streptomyces sp. NPDC059688]|uniref:hypothetical protein n=1 Tax=Streptomyces sp. NPDC059688 TaxID=3346906 RepID=UPI003675DAAC
MLNFLLIDALDNGELWQRLTRQLLEVLPEATEAPWDDPAALQESLTYLPAERPAGRHMLNESDNVAAVAGTIQSAKGDTHAATLVLECLDRTGKKHDVTEVLALLAGAGDITRASTTVRRAAQLVFVGATRPTHLLVLAAPAEKGRAPYRGLGQAGMAHSPRYGSLLVL